MIIFMESDIWLFLWSLIYDYFYGVWYMIIFMESDIW